MNRCRGMAVIVLLSILALASFAAYKALMLLLHDRAFKAGVELAEDVVVVVDAWSRQFDARCVAHASTVIAPSELVTTKAVAAHVTNGLFALQTSTLPRLEITINVSSSVTRAALASRLSAAKNIAPTLAIQNTSIFKVTAIRGNGAVAGAVYSGGGTTGAANNLVAVSNSLMLQGATVYGVTGC